MEFSALVSRTSFGGETSGSVAKCRLFFQAKAASIAAKLRATMSAAYSDNNLVQHAPSCKESLSLACLILAYSMKDSAWIK